MSFIIQFLEETLKLVFEAIVALFKLLLGIKKPGYNAQLGLERASLKSRNKGWCITGLKSLDETLSYRNFLLIGQTGSGKSTISIIPTLLKTTGSFVVNDPSGELYEKSSGFLRKQGVRLIVLNFACAKKSFGYNPLKFANSIAEINKLATTIIRASLNKSNDPFWEQQGISLISFLIRLLKYQEGKYQTLANVLHILNALGANSKALDVYFASVQDEGLFSEYLAFVAYDQKVQAGIIATCKAALHFTADPEIQKLTNHNSLSFKKLRQERTAIFIQNKVADQKLYAPLTSVLFEQLFGYLMKDLPEKEDLSVFLIIDELSSLYLSTLNIAAANVRKYRAGLLLALQDFNQLVDVYGHNEAHAIKANCFAQLYMTGMSHQQSKELSDLLGKRDFETEEGRRTLPLKTHDDLRTLPENRGILLLGNRRPILARLKPYYKQRILKKKSLVPSPKITLTKKAKRKRVIELLPLEEVDNE